MIDEVLGTEEIVPQQIDPTKERLVSNFFNPVSTSDAFEKEAVARREVGSFFEPYGGVKSIDKRLQLEDLEDISNARGEAQSGAEKLVMMFPRIGSKIVTEVAKIPGEVYGAAEWAAKGFGIENIEESFNNAWVSTIDKAGQDLNEAFLPVYKRKEVEEGGLFRQLISPEFWGTEFADGVGFLVSMMAPGAALRGIGLGEKLIKGVSKVPKIGGTLAKEGKLTKFGMKAADTVNDWSSAGVNTVVESMAEGNETMTNLKDQFYSSKFKELVDQGYEQSEADALANEFVESPEIKARIGQAGYGTFTKNLAILIGPNILDQKWLFNGFNKAAAGSVIKDRMKNVLGKTDDVLEDITRLTPKQVRNKVLTQGLIGVGKEGFFEEGMQYAASEFEKQKAIDPSKATSLLQTYAEGLADTDMQKSIFLGALLGGGMGMIGGARKTAREESYLFGEEAKEYGKFRKFLGAKDRPERKGVINIFKDNFIKRYQSAEDLYERDTDGKIKLDNNQQPIISEAKLVELGDDTVRDIIESEQLKDLAANGDKEGYEYIKNIRDLKYMAPFVKEEGGYDLLKAHINNLANSELEEIQKTGLYSDKDINDIKQDLLKKAEIINNVYNKGTKTLADLFETNDTNKKYAASFSDALMDTYISSQYMLDIANNKSSQLRGEVSKYLPTSIETKSVTFSELVPGQVIKENGEIKQVYQAKDGELKTFNTEGKSESVKKENIDSLELVTNITPADRKLLFSTLGNLNGYQAQIKPLQEKLEAIYTKKGQQDAFDEYSKDIEKVVKAAKDVPTEEAKEKIKTSETIEEVKETKQSIAKSDLSEKEKAALQKAADEQQRLLESQAAANGTLNIDSVIGSFQAPSETPQETLPDVSGIQFEAAPGIQLGNLQFQKPEIVEPPKEVVNVSEQLTQTKKSRDTTNNYEINKRQEGKEKELNKPEDKLSESEFKTTFTNIAYLAVEYKEDGVFLTNKLDAQGNIIFGTDEHSIPSIPNEYKPGTKLVMFIDTKNSNYEANKDNLESIPIAIQTLEDYQAGKQPSMYLHRMDWINTNRVAEAHVDKVKEQTLNVRKLLFKTKQSWVTEVTYKSNGWINKPTKKATKEAKQLTINEVAADDKRVKIGFGQRDGTLETDGSIDVINGKSVVSGIPYLMLPTANGSFFASWLKQEAIKKNPNFRKYNETVIAIIEGYINNTIAVKTLDDLRKEVGKYYHVNTGKFTDEVLKYENKNLIFHIQETDKGDIQIVLHGIEGGKSVLYNYYYTKGKGWQYNTSANKTIIPVQGKMSDELGKKVSDKYPNITKEGVEAGDKFQVFELENGTLVRKTKSYNNFLSENRVVTTPVQPHVVNGVRTYFSQPNIAINTDISQMKTVEAKPEVEKTPLETLSDTIQSKIKETVSKMTVDKDKKKYSEKYSDLLRDLELLSQGSNLVTKKEFVEDYKNLLLDFISEESINNIFSEDNLEMSEIISNFEELINQLKSQEFTDKQKSEGERIEKFCKGLGTGKGNIISR